MSEYRAVLGRGQGRRYRYHHGTYTALGSRDDADEVCS